MLGRKTVFGVSGSSIARHVLAELLRARVGIVVGTVPFDRAILGHDFVAALARHRHRADLAEAPQAVIVLGVPRQVQHFKRAPQIHVQAALLRLAVQRGRAVNHRVRGMHQPVVFIAVQSEAGSSQVSAKDADLRLQVLVEAREIRGATAARATAAAALPADRAPAPAHSRRRRAASADWRQRARRCIRSSRSGISPRGSVGPSLHGISVCGAQAEKCEEAAASRGRPSIKGYVQRRSAGM